MCKARLILTCAVLVFCMSGGNGCAVEKNEVSEQQIQTLGLDTGLIEKIIGIKGMKKNGEYKIAVPQNEVVVCVERFLVGLITLFGIATRSGILMISHYQHLGLVKGNLFGKPSDRARWRD